MEMVEGADAVDEDHCPGLDVKLGDSTDICAHVVRIWHLVADAAITLLLLLRVTLELIATHHVIIVWVMNGTGFDLARFPVKGSMALDTEHLIAA